MKIGIIGYGRWGKKLHKEYGAILGESNVIIHDPPAEIINSEIYSVDGVHIATPPLTHYKVAKEFITRSIPVLIEKPMCMSARECLWLADLARRHRVSLMVGHIFRYSDAVKKLVGSRPKKRVKFVWKHSSHARNVLWDLLPHIFDMCNYITGEWPERLRSVQNERNAFVNGYLCNVPLSIELSLNYEGKIRCIEIDDETHHILQMQKNNTIRAEALEFIHRINHKVSVPSTDAFLGYITVQLIEGVDKRWERRSQRTLS